MEEWLQLWYIGEVGVAQVSDWSAAVKRQEVRSAAEADDAGGRFNATLGGEKERWDRSTLSHSGKVSSAQEDSLCSESQQMGSSVKC